MKAAMEAVQETHGICEAAHLLHGRHPRSEADQVFAEVLPRRSRKELEKMGAHFLAIKDMAGLCRPYAAQRAGEGAEGGDRHPGSLPHARHQRHQRRLHPARERCAGWMWSIWPSPRMSGSTSQPNLNSIVAALQHTPRDTGLDLGSAERVLRLLGAGARISTRPSTPRRARAMRGLFPRDAGRAVHQSQGAGGIHGARPPLAGDRAHLCGGE